MRHDKRGYGNALEIDDTASYIFTSQGLDIDLGSAPTEPVKLHSQNFTAYIEVGAESFDCQISSLETTLGGLCLRVSVGHERESFARALMSKASASVLILGEQFNARIFKLEFDLAYLDLTR